MGHYLAARWRGLKIERFSIGMGPRVFGWTDKHGVEWRLSAIPLGGYVMLPQMTDMKVVEGTPDDDAAALPKLSWTDKVVVAVAGAVFNVIFAFCLGTSYGKQGSRVKRGRTQPFSGMSPKKSRRRMTSQFPVQPTPLGSGPGTTFNLSMGAP